MRFTFQQSRIWEAGNPVDPAMSKVTVKAPSRKGEAGARKLLPRPDLGRVWVLVDVDDQSAATFTARPRGAAA